MKDRSWSVGTLAFMAAVGAFLAAFLVYPTLYVFREAFWIEGHFSLRTFANRFRTRPAGQSILNSIAAGTHDHGAHDAAGGAAGVRGGAVVLPRERRADRAAARADDHAAVRRRHRHAAAAGARRDASTCSSRSSASPRTGLDFLGAGGFWAVVLLEVLHLYPIMYLNVAAALANVDPSLEEAARNMGDSGFRLFRKVTFPLMLPGYFAGAVLVFIWAFTDLGTPLIFDYQSVVALQDLRRGQRPQYEPDGLRAGRHRDPARRGRVPRGQVLSSAGAATRCFPKGPSRRARSACLAAGLRPDLRRHSAPAGRRAAAALQRFPDFDHRELVRTPILPTKITGEVLCAGLAPSARADGRPQQPLPLAGEHADGRGARRRHRVHPRAAAVPGIGAARRARHDAAGRARHRAGVRICGRVPRHCRSIRGAIRCRCS